jgi:hypothetical protein
VVGRAGSTSPTNGVVKAHDVVLAARFRPGGFTARFGPDATALTGRVEPVNDDLFCAPIHLEDNIESAAAGPDVAIAVGNGETDPTYAALTACATTTGCTESNR